MDSPSHDTIDALLAELVPTTRLGEPPKPDLDPIDQPAHPPAPGGPGRRHRPHRPRPLRVAVALLAIGLAAALFAAGMVVGRRTADPPPAPQADGADGPGDAQLGSDQGHPFGTASLNSEAGDAAQTDPTGLVARYRQELAARDLVSTTLGDDDLTRFGYAACVFAASAEGPADFERFRTAAVADADSPLSDADMEMVIDTAVVVFCPVDAQRLGITT